jgi:hypothetical protein
MQSSPFEVRGQGSSQPFASPVQAGLYSSYFNREDLCDFIKRKLLEIREDEGLTLGNRKGCDSILHQLGNLVLDQLTVGNWFDDEGGVIQ